MLIVVVDNHADVDKGCVDEVHVTETKQNHASIAINSVTVPHLFDRGMLVVVDEELGQPNECGA